MGEVYKEIVERNRLSRGGKDRDKRDEKEEKGEGEAVEGCGGEWVLAMLQGGDTRENCNPVDRLISLKLY